jgi:hypothetical protein
VFAKRDYHAGDFCTEFDADHGKLHVKFLEFLRVADSKFKLVLWSTRRPFGQPAKVEPHLQSFFQRATGIDRQSSPCKMTPAITRG